MKYIKSHIEQIIKNKQVNNLIYGDVEEILPGTV